MAKLENRRKDFIKSARVGTYYYKCQTYNLTLESEPQLWGYVYDTLFPGAKKAFENAVEEATDELDGFMFLLVYRVENDQKGHLRGVWVNVFGKWITINKFFETIR